MVFHVTMSYPEGITDAEGFYLVTTKTRADQVLTHYWALPPFHTGVIGKAARRLWYQCYDSSVIPKV